MRGGTFMETCGYMWGKTQKKDLEALLQGLFLWWTVQDSNL